MKSYKAIVILTVHARELSDVEGLLNGLREGIYDEGEPHLTGVRILDTADSGDACECF